MQSIILASQSPRRKQLLEWAEVPFEIITCDTEETYPAHIPIAEVPVYIARKKALAVQLSVESATTPGSGRPILAADTIVVCRNEVLGKPQNRQHAIEMLLKLQGSVHKVITGVVILHQGETAFADTTVVEFHSLSQQQIEFYVDKYKPYDKAGAYAIQEWIGVVGIKSVQGDFYNVMGLPVSRVIQALKQLQ